MITRDLITISSGNLRRLKLRTALTAAGVLIAIAAFVSMLSFGAGNQANIERQFNELGLFTTIQVYPKNTGEREARRGGRERDVRPNPGGQDSAAKLDAKALDRIAAIPGVNLVYPYDAFEVSVRAGDTVVGARGQALPPSAMKTKVFSRFASGHGFDSSNAREVIISEDLFSGSPAARADSLVGRTIVVSVRVSSLDSAVSHILVDQGVTLFDRARRIRFDSLRYGEYRSRFLRSESNEIVRRFVSGFLTAKSEIVETLTVCGVRPRREGSGRMRIESVVLPIAVAARFKSAGLPGDPLELLSAMRQGQLFPETPGGPDETFTQATVDFDPKVFHKTITDSIEALGYSTFSFAGQFEQIQKAFMYLDLALALIGMIALTTASLGIVNTMVMSITERRKEIGILKSLGADDRDIRILFLAESGMIGLLGTVGGIIFGWLIGRAGSLIARTFMAREGIPPVELFALPWWLILISLVIGVTVSVAAGYLPAARAARVDPVEALRNE